MFQTQLYELVAGERHKDLLREAENDRLVDMASTIGGQHHWHYRALAFIGSRLIAWGNRLQKHYDDRATSTLQIACDER